MSGLSSRMTRTSKLRRGVIAERAHLLEADDVGGERAQLIDGEREPPIERRLGPPEVQRDDAEVLAHAPD